MLSGVAGVSARVVLLGQVGSTLAANGGQRATCTGIAVKTLPPSSLTQVSAQLRGQVTACGATNVKAWFQILRPSRPATAKAAIPPDRNQHQISAKLTRLSSQQSVSYRVMAQKGTRLITGNTVRFSTSPPSSLKVSALANVGAGQSFKVSATGLNSQKVSVGDVTSHTTFTLSPDGSCTGSTCRATVAGAHTVHAKDGAATGTGHTAVAAGSLDHLMLSPGTATVCPQLSAPTNADLTCATSYSQTFAAEGFDAYGNDLGDMTSATTFSIATPGSCTATDCSVGSSTEPETVTGTDGTARGTATLTGSDALGMTCQGENYDVDGSMGNGCELAQPNPGYTSQATALAWGSETCNDTDKGSQAGATLSDRRTHTNPTVGGFDTAIGSAPFWLSISATGGSFCTDDYSLTFKTSGGGNTACYRATIKTDKITQSTATLTGSGTDTITGGASSYSDGSTAYIEVQKLCDLPVQEAVGWTLSWHL